MKAVYQRYLSWYDGNPANLWRLPPADVGPRYVELAGGADALLDRARQAFEAGEYRWVVELVSHLVFADAGHTEARELQADAFEQLGYQSESATFRNAFLTGAQELRNGRLPSRPAGRHGYLDAMTIDQLVDSVAVRLMAEDVGGIAVTVNFTFTDVGEDWALVLSNRTLHAVPRHERAAATTIRLSTPVLHRVIDGATTLADAVASGEAAADGDVAAASQIFDHLDTFMSNFALVEP